MTPEEVRALSDEARTVFVSDIDMLRAMAVGAFDYSGFLVGTGFSLPGAVIERHDDFARRGVVFRVARAAQYQEEMNDAE